MARVFTVGVSVFCVENIGGKIFGDSDQASAEVADVKGYAQLFMFTFGAECRVEPAAQRYIDERVTVNTEELKGWHDAVPHVLNAERLRQTIASSPAKCDPGSDLF